MVPSSSRRTTGRVHRHKEEQNKDEAVGSLSKPSPSAPSKVSRSGNDSKRTLAPEPSQSSTPKKNVEEPKPATISKRQQIIPATNGSKPSSKKIPITDDKKPITTQTTLSKPIQKEVVTNTKDSKKIVSKVPIQPLKEAQTGSSSKRAVAKETAPEQEISASERKRVIENSKETVEVKASTKRAKVAANSERVSNKSGRSAKAAPRRKSSKTTTNAMYIMVGVLVLLIAMIGFKLLKGPTGGKTIVQLNDLDRGIAICQEGRKLYKSNPDNVNQALSKLNEGITIVEDALNKLRNSNNDLPAQYAGYDSQLGEFYQARKVFKEQALILGNQKNFKK